MLLNISADVHTKTIIIKLVIIAETLSFRNFENFETDPESEAAAGAAV